MRIRWGMSSLGRPAMLFAACDLKHPAAVQYVVALCCAAVTVVLSAVFNVLFCI